MVADYCLALMPGICQFLSCKHSHGGRFEATSVRLLKVALGREAFVALDHYSWQEPARTPMAPSFSSTPA